MNAPDRGAIRLTQFSHGGGCGCKVAPAALARILNEARRTPQTSGGLLAAVAPEAVASVLAIFPEQGYAHAAAIGECVAGSPKVRVR